MLGGTDDRNLAALRAKSIKLKKNPLFKRPGTHDFIH